MNASKTWTAAGLIVVGVSLCSLLTAEAQVATGGLSLRPIDGKMLRAVSSCANSMAVEPVLIYNLSGGTLLGPMHLCLVVYGDGLATISRRDSSTPPAGTAESKHVSPASLQSLSLALAAAGAELSCDQVSPVMQDVPLATVTVFSASGTDAAAHTFSYWQASSGPYGAVESILQDFIGAEFEPF